MLLIGLIAIFVMTYFVYKHRNVDHAALAKPKDGATLNEESDNEQEVSEKKEIEAKRKKYGENAQRILSEEDGLTERRLQSPTEKEEANPHSIEKV